MLCRMPMELSCMKMLSNRIEAHQTMFDSIQNKSSTITINQHSLFRINGRSIRQQVVRNNYKCLTISKNVITFWTDSTSVLWPIRQHNRRLKPFVSNRIGEIQMFSSPDQWRYVPTKVNLADHLTQGVKLSELTKLKTWWDYLYKDQEFS